MAQATKIVRESAVPIHDPGVFDREHLRIYTLHCPSLERELIGLFLDQLPVLVRQLEAAASPQDWKFATHTIKGSARAVGATAIAAIAERLESEGPNASGAGELERAVAAFERLARPMLN